MPDAAELKATIGRLGIPWYYTNWADLDDVYDYFYSSGIRPIFTLYVTPAPAFEPGPTTPPTTLPEPPFSGPQPDRPAAGAAGAGRSELPAA